MSKEPVTLHDALGVADMSFKPTHRHLKTGGLYRFLGTCKIEATWTDGVLYDNEEGVLIVRDKSEFEDGRFEPIMEEENGTN